MVNKNEGSLKHSDEEFEHRFKSISTTNVY